MKRYILIISVSIISYSGYGQRLNELLQQAENNYPLLKAKQYDVQSGREKVLNEKSSALPTLDAAYQLNYATYNNITGMATGQYFVPISGPPSTSNTYDAVFWKRRKFTVELGTVYIRPKKFKSWISKSQP
jgi:hypothetical protein